MDMDMDMGVKTHGTHAFQPFQSGDECGSVETDFDSPLSGALSPAFVVNPLIRSVRTDKAPNIDSRNSLI